jgi:transcriptional regulator with XRE-family HTH domain
MNHEDSNWLRADLDGKMKVWQGVVRQPIPPGGWLRAARQALRMPLRIVAERMGISAQALQHLEQREKLGSITLNRLIEVAGAMELRLCYGLVVERSTLDERVRQQAERKAMEWESKQEQNRKSVLGLDAGEYYPDEVEFIINSAPLEWNKTERFNYYDILNDEYHRSLNKHEQFVKKLMEKPPADFWDDGPP